MLPDTQIYAKSHPKLFHAQTKWIADNARKENIVFVTQVGDIINDRAKIPEQWEVASAAMARLDGVVPWGVAIGNHDFDGVDDKTQATTFLKYFGPQRFKGRPWFGGAAPNGLSTYQLFSGGGVDFIILHLEIDAPDAAIAWAADVLHNLSDACRHHLDPRLPQGPRRRRPARQARLQQQGNSAQQVWDKLIPLQSADLPRLCGPEGRTENTASSRPPTPATRGGSVVDYQRRTAAARRYLRQFRLSRPRTRSKHAPTRGPRQVRDRRHQPVHAPVGDIPTRAAASRQPRTGRHS